MTAGRRARSGPAAPVVAALVAAGLLLLGGCAGQGPSAVEARTSAPVPAGDRSATGRSTSEPEPLDVRTGRPADSTRVRFVPQTLTLPGNARAPVKPAVTVDGELRVPEDVQHVGWWDGSAYAGDPFGSTVIAGHVDSRTAGVGFFARLLGTEIGDKLTVSGDGHRASYRVVAVSAVAKEALAADSRAFDQRGDHRLVLVTCTGRYRPERGGYDSNLVVVAAPVGRPG
ncbi:MAG: class F sortase [Actinomycetes bacterium]